jgi:D-alanyl-D-alanine carboxypeptidase (penicillin-binding protein 5/6)
VGRWSVVTVLVVAGAVVAPVPAVAEPSAPTAAAPAAVVPCPYQSLPTLPPTPPSTIRDPGGPVIGGEQLGTAGLAVPPGTPPPPATAATTWVVADLDSGDVVAACGAHVRRRPASVQKLLLAATALPLMPPDQVVVATAEDVALPSDSSAVGLLVGGLYPVSTLWYGLLLQSGNDTANALARTAGGAGGIAATVAAMNAEAYRLGAEDTHASNPHGLDEPDQYTSAYDLALIARVDFNREDFLRYDTLASMPWPAQPPRDPTGFQIQNENQLLRNYPGALGGKTGFTDEARHTYVGAAQRNGRRLVVTLMGAEISPFGRTWKQASMLLDWAFAVAPTTSVGHLVTPEEMARRRTPPPPAAGPTTEATGGVTVAGGASAGSVWGILGALLALVASVLVLAVVRLVRLVRGRRSLRGPAGTRREGGLVA